MERGPRFTPAQNGVLGRIEGELKIIQIGRAV